MLYSNVRVCIIVCVRRLSKRVRPERSKTARGKRASGSTGGVYFFSQNFISGRRRVGDGHGIEQQLDDPTTLPATSLQQRRWNCFPKWDNISIILLLLFVVLVLFLFQRPSSRDPAGDRLLAVKTSLRIFLNCFHSFTRHDIPTPIW